uniref:Eco57I restriction-modification methylase domain-containing protein n=1 Tax=Chryseobacterium sp. R2A-55 TaxID=2744445 RepID=UPI001F1E2D51
QQLEAWKTSGFARKFKSGTERFCSPDYAQKMPVLQRRKPGGHCHFRATWSATGFSFPHPNFLCEITFAGKGTFVLQRRKPAEPACRQTEPPSKGYQTPQKKAVILKNCFAYLNSKNDNSIEEPILKKSHRSFRSTGFHCWLFKPNESLVILGLIFEKINGYKDGSFYTPGSITMYMSREVLRKAVLQKFNEVNNWSCEDFTQLYNNISDIKSANDIVNSVKICDPAVGSGHFLVSVLNEMIAIKNDLGILADKDGRRFKDYNVEVESDEIVITDTSTSELFRYNPKNKESQRVQETLFHEKQTIIENCLFGVDLNPNSVKICRLRLWIELLKNAYYKSETELETLPNIDINIKNGNSLISRFPLDSDLKSTFSKSKVTVEDYKNAVRDYKEAENKEKKRNLEEFLASLKNDFRTEISRHSKEMKTLNLLRGEFFTKYGSEQLFGTDLTKAQQKDKKDLENRIQKIEDIIEEVKGNKIYENAFEWRFEFPEVLDDEGNFIGFDVIIGNPPYIQLQKMGADSDALQKVGYETFIKTGDIYSLFYEQGYNIMRENGLLMFITSNKWMRANYGESLRRFFVEQTNPLTLIDFSGNQIFDTATVDTNILMFAKHKNEFTTQACVVKEKLLNNLSDFVNQNSEQSQFITSESWVILSPIEQSIKRKIEAVGKPLKEWDIRINYGIKTGFNEAFIITGEKRRELIEQDPKSEEIIRPILRGRDIKKYSYEFGDLWLLYIPWHFPLEDNPNIIGASKDAEVKFQNEYPAIYKHLLSHKENLLKRNKAETGVRYEWYALQRWGANYRDDLTSQKIIWGEISDKTKFCLDLHGNFMNEATTFLMTGTSLPFLLGFLNSKLSEYLFSKIGTTTGVGTVRWKKFTIEQLPVPVLEEEQKNILEKLVLQIVLSNGGVEIERDINNKIYEFLHFSQDEVIFIESQ